MCEWNECDDLLFHLDDCHQVPIRNEGSQRLFSEDIASSSFSQRLGVTSQADAASVIAEQRCIQDACSTLKAETSSNLRTLALMLASKYNHTVCIRSSLGPQGSDSHPARRLRHSFILIAGDSEGPNTIVDPYFQDQFQIGLHDPEYSSFLDSQVPEVFVGKPQEMASMLQSICHAMHAALERLQVGIPPWRRMEAVASMWAPVTFRDEHLAPCSSSTVSLKSVAAATEQPTAHLSYGSGNRTQQSTAGVKSARAVSHDIVNQLPQQAVSKVVIGFAVPQNGPAAAKAVEALPPAQAVVCTAMSLSEDSDIPSERGYGYSYGSASSSLSSLDLPHTLSSGGSFQDASHAVASLSQVSNMSGRSVYSSDSVAVMRSLSIGTVLIQSRNYQPQEDIRHSKPCAAAITAMVPYPEAAQTDPGKVMGSSKGRSAAPQHVSSELTGLVSQNTGLGKPPLDQLLPRVWTVKLRRR